MIQRFYIVAHSGTEYYTCHVDTFEAARELCTQVAGRAIFSASWFDPSLFTFCLGELTVMNLFKRKKGA